MGWSSRQRVTRWCRWVDPSGYPWHVGLTWARDGTRRSRLVGFELWSTPPGSDRVDLGPEEQPGDEPFAALGPPPPPVTSRLLRSLPLHRVAAPARDEVLDALDALPAGDGAEIRRVVDTRQPRYTLDHYTAVADLYREAEQAGLYPLAWINERYPWASRQAVAGWVWRCRHRLGLLEPVGHKCA